MQNSWIILKATEESRNWKPYFKKIATCNVGGFYSRATKSIFLLARSFIDPTFCGIFVCGPLQFKCPLLHVMCPQHPNWSESYTNYVISYSIWSAYNALLCHLWWRVYIIIALFMQLLCIFAKLFSLTSKRSTTINTYSYILIHLTYFCIHYTTYNHNTET